MHIYLSKQQHDFYKKIRNTLGKFYEQTRDQNIIYKWRGIAFIDKGIKVKIENGLPTTASYHKIPLGQCYMKKQSGTDVGFEIGLDKKFMEYCKNNKSFILTVHSIDDGFFYGDASYIDKIDEKIINFTDHQKIADEC